MAPETQAAASVATLARIPTTGLANNTYGNYIFNSGNHGGDGQEVGYADDHVAWATNPYVGTNQDNIFTYMGTNTTPATAGGGAPTAALGTGATAAQGQTSAPSIAPYDIFMVPERNVSSGNW